MLDFSVGDYVTANVGWTTHAVCDSSSGFKLDSSIPEDKRSTALGVLGMPGATAYLGLQDVCKPKAGQTLVVNAAAGAVGSVVGQIAKIRGCRVVGFAGSDAKVEYLKSIGFDVAINYKTMSSLDEVLKENCPDGIDMFYDHVGGEGLTTTLNHMNQFGRVCLVGMISEYNLAEPLRVPTISKAMIFRQLEMKGFAVHTYLKDWPAAFKDMAAWIKEGKLKYKEHVTNGFENIFDAFMGLFRGDNIGKAVIKV